MDGAGPRACYHFFKEAAKFWRGSAAYLLDGVHVVIFSGEKLEAQKCRSSNKSTGHRCVFVPRGFIRGGRKSGAVLIAVPERRSSGVGVGRVVRERRSQGCASLALSGLPVTCLPRYVDKGS